MSEAKLGQIADALASATTDGLYPIVAHGVEGKDLLTLTTSIADLPLAMKILKAGTGREYNLGYSFKKHLLQKLAEQNPHVLTLKIAQIEGLDQLELKELGRVVWTFGAPFFNQKGFGLVDIVGFSQLANPDQLSQLYSLNSMKQSAMKRCYKFCQRLGIPNRFGFASTGDGFYVWHDLLGGGADVATFMFVACLMVQSEAMRSRGFALRLRAAFVIDSAYMLYDSSEPFDRQVVASNAVGAATNGAARLIGSAAPSQILVGDFTRDGQPGEKLNSRALIAQANELFREEGLGAASLTIDPDDKLRVTDKHGIHWYCFNVAGEIPNLYQSQQDRQSVGVKPDTARDMSSIKFRA